MKKLFFGFVLALAVGGIVGSLFLLKKEKRSKSNAPTVQKPFVVVIPSYNNSAFCEQNLISVLSQNYQNFRVIYIDDCSTDDTFEKVSALVAISPLKSKVSLISNPSNLGALNNLYNAIHCCLDEEIIVTVDGDDFLAHSGVLKRLNEVYADENVWMTYGNFLDYPTYRQNPVICKPIPKSVIQSNSYRKAEWVTSHLRTFYAGLFKKIEKNDFLYEGKFLPMGWDLAFMIPMLEMAHGHFRFIDEVLYLYNRSNPINDHKKNLKLQSDCAAHIRQLPSYEAIAIR